VNVQQRLIKEFLPVSISSAWADTLSYFKEGFDDVGGGVSKGAAFFARMTSKAETVFGSASPVGKTLATVNTDIQQAAAALQVPAAAATPGATIAAVPGALVTTYDIAVNVWDTIDEAAKAEFAQLNLPANATWGQKFDAVYQAVLPLAVQVGVPLGLGVLPGGGFLTFAAPTLEKMLTLILSEA
jgi:hypothetical protein